MIVRMERSGGFAGMKLKAVIDTDQLDPQERQELEKLVEEARFFETRLKTRPHPSEADRFHYELTIEQGAQQRTVELDEADIPPGWEPLIQRLNLLARRFRA